MIWDEIAERDTRLWTAADDERLGASTVREARARRFDVRLVLVLRALIIVLAVVLLVAAAIVMPNKLHSHLSTDTDPLQVSGVEAALQPATPFAGWNPDVEAWAKQYGWGSMHDMSVKWSDPVVSEVTSEK